MKISIIRYYCFHFFNIKDNRFSSHTTWNWLFYQATSKQKDLKQTYPAIQSWTDVSCSKSGGNTRTANKLTLWMSPVTSWYLCSNWTPSLLVPEIFYFKLLNLRSWNVKIILEVLKMFAVYIHSGSLEFIFKLIKLNI